MPCKAMAGAAVLAPSAASMAAAACPKERPAVLLRHGGPGDDRLKLRGGDGGKHRRLGRGEFQPDGCGRRGPLLEQELFEIGIDGGLEDQHLDALGNLSAHRFVLSEKIFRAPRRPSLAESGAEPWQRVGRGLLLEGLLHVVDRLAHGADFLEVLVGNLDVELFGNLLAETIQIGGLRPRSLTSLSSRLISFGSKPI